MSMAPADSRARHRWPWWRILLAYLMLSLLAALSVWFVDRDAMRRDVRQTETAFSNITP